MNLHGNEVLAGNNGIRLTRWMRENINLMVLLVMICIGACISGAFFTVQNWQNILRQVSVNGIMAAGVTLVFLAGGFDLSIGATLSLCGCLAVGLQQTFSIGTSIVIAIVVGGLMGLLNGALIVVTRGELSETFLITLGTSLLGQSLALTYTGGMTMYTTRNTPYDFWGKGALFGIPFAAVLVVVILLVFQFILKKTRPGRQIYITGGGKETAFLSGINTNKIKICVFVIAGVCAAFAGIIMSSRTTAASYAMGNGADFDACIAVLIGGNVLGGGKGGMVQTFIGILIFGLISNILNLAGIVPVIQIILKGVILLLAILLDGIKQD